MSKLTEKILKDGDVVEFDWNDSKAPTPGQSYGRAEFFICLVWNTRGKRPRLKEFFVYPQQQRDVKHYYRVKCGWSNSFQAQAWTHKGMEEPKVWLHSWCKEHKGPSFRLYVPPFSKNFRVTTLSTVGIDFGK